MTRLASVLLCAALVASLSESTASASVRRGVKKPSVKTAKVGAAKTRTSRLPKANISLARTWRDPLPAKPTSQQTEAFSAIAKKYIHEYARHSVLAATSSTFLVLRYPYQLAAKGWKVNNYPMTVLSIDARSGDITGRTEVPTVDSMSLLGTGRTGNLFATNGYDGNSLMLIGKDGALRFNTKVDFEPKRAITLPKGATLVVGRAAASMVGTKVRYEVLNTSGKRLQATSLTVNAPKLSKKRLESAAESYSIWESQQPSHPDITLRPKLPIAASADLVVLPIERTTRKVRGATSVMLTRALRKDGSVAWEHPGNVRGQQADGSMLLVEPLRDVSKGPSKSRVSVIEKSGTIRWTALVEGTVQETRVLPGGHLLVVGSNNTGDGTLLVYSAEGERLLASNGGEVDTANGKELLRKAKLHKTQEARAQKKTEAAQEKEKSTPSNIFHEAVKKTKRVRSKTTARGRQALKLQATGSLAAVVRDTGVSSNLVKLVDGLDASTDGTTIFIGRDLALLLPPNVLRDIINHERAHIMNNDGEKTSILDDLLSSGAINGSERNTLVRNMEFRADSISAVAAALEGRSVDGFAKFLKPTEKGPDHPSGVKRAKLLQDVLAGMQQGIKALELSLANGPRVSPFLDGASSGGGSPFLDGASSGGGSPFLDGASSGGGSPFLDQGGS